MTRFQVTVVEYRDHKLIIDAIDEDAALDAAARQVRANAQHWTAVEAPQVEAVEALALSESFELAGGPGVPSGMAPRHSSASSPDGGGARHLGPSQIARRFGLTTSLIAAALMFLSGPPARATVSGSSDWFNYTGPSFTSFGGVSCPHDCAISGKIGLSSAATGDLSPYLINPNNPNLNPNHEIDVQGVSGVIFGVFIGDGNSGHNPPLTWPQVGGSFDFKAFLMPDLKSIDFSKGWDLTITWTTATGQFDQLISSWQGSLGTLFPGDFDQVWFGTSFAGESNTLGTWTDPPSPDRIVNGVAVPEASTWAMLITGFVGLGLMLRRRDRAFVRAPVLPNGLRAQSRRMAAVTVARRGRRS